MAAGESAYEVARRQREKAARLQRSADLWELGAAGEVAVARALEALPEGWFGMHDLQWPGRQRANIDHVVVGPGGVFVVDAKNWSGRIEVRDEVLMQDGRRREKMVGSAAEAAHALQEIVPPPALCMSVLCFVRDEPLTGWARDVMVCSTSNLAAMLTSRPPVLTPEDVRRCLDVIGAGVSHRPSAARHAHARPATSSRRPRKGGRSHPVAALIVGVLLLVAVLSGGLQKGGEWVGERMVDVVAPAPAEPSPTAPAKQDRQKKHREHQKPRG